MKLSFFTKDPMIPYFATYYIFETNHILSNKKRKIIKENIADIINGCCTQLKYKIDTPAKLLKKNQMELQLQYSWGEKDKALLMGV